MCVSLPACHPSPAALLVPPLLHPPHRLVSSSRTSGQSLVGPPLRGWVSLVPTDWCAFLPLIADWCAACPPCQAIRPSCFKSSCSASSLGGCHFTCSAPPCWLLPCSETVCVLCKGLVILYARIHQDTQTDRFSDTGRGCVVLSSAANWPCASSVSCVFGGNSKQYPWRPAGA